MRWKRLKQALALLLAGVIGCKQTAYMTEGDVQHYQELMPANLENDTKVGAQPIVPLCPEPATILKPDRPIRFISLAEAMAIALEQGTVGNQRLDIVQSLFFGGTVTSFDQPVSFNGGTGGRVGQSDSIRVLRLDGAIVGTAIESALSKFDAVWNTQMSWNTTDRPIASSVDQIQAGNQDIADIKQQDSNFSTSILKPLPDGGVVGITFKTDYQFTNLPARVNPSYRPSLQVGFEQPLLQGFGVEINQLRAAHPGSLLFPGILNTQPTAEGILITRLRYDQQRTEFERDVHFMVLNVEVAYWNLYHGYWNLYAQEQGLRQAFEAFNINKAKYNAGKVAIAELAQARGQYETFRAQRLQALSDVLEHERILRGMLGMVPEDGKRLVPSDQPTLALYLPDWETSLQEAYTLLPSLHLARQEVKAAQMNLRVAENQLLPDLRFAATYDVNSIGNRLDGPEPNGDQTNAFRSLAGDRNNNWTAQLRLNVPIGWRNAYANVRIAKLQLVRAYEQLKDQEYKTQRFLAQRYRAIFVNYELIRTQRAAREAFGEQLRAKFAEFLAGRGTLDILLEAQRFWADALNKEYQAVRHYNNALAAFETAKGTILIRNNIVISEGALPTFAQKRAVEHQRERSAALELRQRADYVPLNDVTATHAEQLNLSTAPSLPTLFSQVAPLKSNEIPSLPSSPTSDAAKMPLSLPKGPANSDAVHTPMLPSVDDPAKAPPALPNIDALKAPAAPSGPATLPIAPKPVAPVVPTTRTSSTFGTLRTMDTTSPVSTPASLPQDVSPPR